MIQRAVLDFFFSHPELKTEIITFQNCQLVSDSVKMKQNISSLLAEKQAKTKQLQQVNYSVEFLKMKMARGEEQVPF